MGKASEELSGVDTSTSSQEHRGVIVYCHPHPRKFFEFRGYGADLDWAENRIKRHKEEITEKFGSHFPEYRIQTAIIVGRSDYTFVEPGDQTIRERADRILTEVYENSLLPDFLLRQKDLITDNP